MTKAKWIGAVAAAVAIVGALAAGLWFGGGPTSREGWEAASWAAGVTAALALIVTAVVWAVTPAPSYPLPPHLHGGSNDVVNSVGNVSGSTVIQGRDVTVEKPSYGGDHIDFRGGTFDGTAIGKQTNRPPGPGAGDH